MKTAPAAPVRSLDQRMEALRLANEIRNYRARLKQQIHAGNIDATLILQHPGPKVATMKVWDLVRSVPSFGRCKTDRALRRARISPSKTIGGLTSRQRDELLLALQPSPYQQRKMEGRRAA